MKVYLGKKNMDKSSWYDILPPVTPVDNTATFIWTGILVLFCIFALVFFLWRNSPKQRCLRELDNLSNNLSGSYHLKIVPFQIRSIIRQCFNVININHIVMPDEENWEKYKDKLVSACFRRNSLPQQEIENLLLESRYWIKQRTTGK